MTRERVFLEMAKNDLEVAKHLYRKGFYSHSIFNLQQSTEKAVKSLGLWVKAITITEARSKVRHRSVKVYFQIFKKLKNVARSSLPDLKTLQEKFPKLRVPSLIPDRTIIERLEQESEKLQNEVFTDKAGLEISSNTYRLLDILNRIENLMMSTEISIKRVEKSLRRLADGDSKVLEEMRRPIYEIFQDRMKAKNIGQDDGRRMIDELISHDMIVMQAKSFRRFIRLNMCSGSLFWMSLILSPHAARTRYPDTDFNPLEYYNPEMPLVKLLNDFVEILQKTYEIIEAIYNETPNSPVKADY